FRVAICVHALARMAKGSVFITIERCKGCGFCVEFCPTHVLSLSSAFNSKGYHPPHVVASGKYRSCSLRSCFRTPQSTELARSNLLRNAAAGARVQRRAPCCSPAPRIACAGTEPDDWRESWSGGRLAEGAIRDLLLFSPI